MLTMRTVTSAMLGIVAFAFASPAISQTAAEEFIYYPSDPNEYYLFSEMDQEKVVDSETEKTVKVCLNENRHLVPLEVSHDAKKSMVEPGDCLRVEAREVHLEPGGRLEPAWSIKAEVETKG